MALRFGNARAQDVGVAQFATSGYMWFSGTGRVAVANNNFLKATIALAADAPKTITIVRTSLITTGAAFTHMMVNPTTDVPTTVKRVDNAILDARTYAGKVTCKVDTGVTEMTGGTLLPVTLGSGGAGRVDAEHTLILRPGFTFGFDTISQGAFTMAFNVYWVELP